MPKPSAYEPPPAAPTGAAGEGQADAYDDERSMSNDTSDRSGTVLPVGQRPGPWSVPKAPTKSDSRAPNKSDSTES